MPSRTYFCEEGQDSYTLLHVVLKDHAVGWSTITGVSYQQNGGEWSSSTHAKMHVTEVEAALNKLSKYVYESTTSYVQEHSQSHSQTIKPPIVNSILDFHLRITLAKTLLISQKINSYSQIQIQPLFNYFYY